MAAYSSLSCGNSILLSTLVKWRRHHLKALSGMLVSPFTWHLWTQNKIRLAVIISFLIHAFVGFKHELCLAKTFASIWFHTGLDQDHLYTVSRVTKLQAAWRWPAEVYPGTLQPNHSGRWVLVTVKKKTFPMAAWHLLQMEINSKKTAFMEINMLVGILWSSSGSDPGITRQWQVSFLSFIHWTGKQQ